MSLNAHNMGSKVAAIKKKIYQNKRLKIFYENFWLFSNYIIVHPTFCMAAPHYIFLILIFVYVDLCRVNAGCPVAPVKRIKSLA